MFFITYSSGVATGGGRGKRRGGRWRFVEIENKSYKYYYVNGTCMNIQYVGQNGRVQVGQNACSLNM